MRPVNTLIPLQSVPTLEALGGPALDLTSRLPANFGWSEITPSSDQGRCGACWAFASVGALNDRFHIWTTLRVRLSAYKMLVCNLGGLEHDIDFEDDTEQINAERSAMAEFECRGNSLEDAWRYLFTNGVPSLDCVPPDALGSTCTQVVGKREDTCPTGRPMRSFRCRAYYSVPPHEVMHEIYERGPVSAAFAVTRDFWGFDFRAGVYEPQKSRAGATGHAVRIVGWGESASEGSWWWVVNSFGRSWGLGGMFRMRRGYLEKNVIAGLPDTFAQAPIYAVKRDRLFRQRVDRMYGLDAVERPFVGNSPSLQLRAKGPIMIKEPQTDKVSFAENRETTGETKGEPKDQKGTAEVDLNIGRSLYEDTHVVFRIAIFVLALVCVCWLWFGHRR
jgi:hypothetical protein